MKLFSGLSILFLVSFAQAQTTTQIFRGQSPGQGGVCELTLKTTPTAVVGFAIKGAGDLQTNFGACENVCHFADEAEDILDPKLFAAYKFREVRADSYPQIVLTSRFVKERTEIVFISRTISIDMTDGSVDEFRYVEGTEVATMTTALRTMNCLHMKLVEGNKRP